MYGLFFDKSALDSKSLINYVSEWRHAKNIVGEDYTINTVGDITSYSEKDGHKYSTIIAIGSESTFEAIVGQAGFFNPTTVFAYIPTNTDLLSKRIGIKDYKDACQVIAQRKIIELTALTANNIYFLFNYNINVTHNSSDSNKVSIHVDKTIDINLETDNFVVHNRNQELLPHSNALLLEAFSCTKQPNNTTNILKLASSKLLNDQANEKKLQLRVPANTIQIGCSSKLTNTQSVHIKSPLKIGFGKKPIRLIVKKGQEPQAIMSPGLIS